MRTKGREIKKVGWKNLCSIKPKSWSGKKEENEHIILVNTKGP